MKEVKVKIQKNGKALVYNNLAGYDGENNASKIIVEMEEFIDGVGIFEIKTNDDEFYVYATKENNTYTMDVLNVLLVQPVIEMQLRITQDEQTIYKSEIFELQVENSINAEQEVPEQYPEWIDVANAKIQEIDDTIEDLEEKVESGYFNGEDGQDGFSPTIETSKVGKTTTITIEDAIGTKTATILDGQDGKDGTVGPQGPKGDKGDKGDTGAKGDKGETGSQGPQGIQGEQGPAGRDGTNGQDGQDGQDGFSPIANVSKSGNTATISITDKLGTTTATVSDGVNGQDGQNGRDGTDGQDGYSPSASVSQSGEVTTISITDKSGTTTASIDISGKLDASKVKSSQSTTSGDVYDVIYINSVLGDIDTILTAITTGGGVN